MFNNNQGCPCPSACPTYNNCNQVVNRCFVTDVPHYTNFHTTVVNNCVRRHVNIPTFSQSEETVVTDEYQNANPAFFQNQPFMNQNMNQGMNQFSQQPFGDEFAANSNSYNPFQNQGPIQGVNTNNFNPFNF